MDLHGILRRRFFARYLSQSVKNCLMIFFIFIFFVFLATYIVSYHFPDKKCRFSLSFYFPARR